VIATEESHSIFTENCCYFPLKLVFIELVSDLNLEFSRSVPITPGKLTLLYQKSKIIAIFRWFHPMEEEAVIVIR
jgi:hypothetical protein